MNRINNKRYFLKIFVGLLVFAMQLFQTITTEAQTKNIKNDIFWNTVDGQPVYSQGGGIFKFKDESTGVNKYYWYGVQYEEADIYRNNPTITQPRATFKSVTCYSSTDLVNWKSEGDVLTKDSVNKEGRTWLGRLGVAYIKEINKYAMFVQHGNGVLITLANSPTGNFKWHQKISMQEIIGTPNTGDQTVFTDEDTGKSYLVYSYGRGRNKIYISEIGVKNGKVDLLGYTQIFQGESREGNCMFKYKGKYYMFASNIYGWDASFAYYLVADDIRGPYLPTNKMLITNGASDDYAHISQTGFFYVLKGSKQETVIYCGDRWANFAGNGLGYNQWCPITFDGSEPYFNSLNSWNLNAETGEWKVAKDNDFVKNGSFEADRKRLPSVVKPVQEQLTGWLTTVIKGNEISFDSTKSPSLNYFNTADDRKLVIGEKSFNISDKVNFEREISQNIISTPSVKLEDGSYTLVAKVKNSNGFKSLQIYALSDQKRFFYPISGENLSWKTITLKNVKVKNGKVEIGFKAIGEANAYCYVDDVSLLRSK